MKKQYKLTIQYVGGTFTLCLNAYSIDAATNIGLAFIDDDERLIAVELVN